MSVVEKVHFVTGKGGVGKSLIAASLARALSLEKKPILLAELNETSFYQDFLSLPQISYKPVAWKSNLDVAQWSPDDCLKEYALHLLKIEGLYKLFMENPVSKSLIQVAPGLHELALLGKITSSPRQHGPTMDHNQLVIDSFATGHFLSLLRAPSAMAEAVQFGPMGEQSRAIDHWVRNSDFTEIHIVTLSEELPITETIEMFEQLKKEFNLTAKVILNKVLDLNLADLKDLDHSIKIDLENRLADEERARVLLREHDISFVEIPLITSVDSDEITKKVSEQLHV